MKNLQATREHLYLQAGLNQTAHDALITFEALVIRVAELEAGISLCLDDLESFPRSLGMNFTKGAAEAKRLLNR